MAPYGENVSIDAKANVAQVDRDGKGVALVNFSDKKAKIKMATTLPDGEYTDAVHGSVFKVKNGTIEGQAAPLASYLLYAK